MNQSVFEIEPFKAFSESLIWQLNRDYYQTTGIDAWSSGVVPHHMTSNSMVGKTYAELILGFLKDLAVKGAIKETVYILELGAGHGRFAFHILIHLERLIALTEIELPPFCYVLSDIVEKNLQFYENHAQLKTYYDKGILDYAYYDAIEGKKLHLRNADLQITTGSLKQPIIAIANYFFDSLPNHLFHIKNKEVSSCSIAIHSREDPEKMSLNQTIKDLKLSYKKDPIKGPAFSLPILNEILEEYRNSLSDTYLFFPQNSILCLDNLRALSTEGLLLLSMDKGVHDIDALDNKKEPEIITHGSLSFWVNYHTLGSYCEKLNGKALFPTYSTFHLQIGCLLFLEDPNSFKATNAAFERNINDFGPDDFMSIKKLYYSNVSKISISHLLAMYRMSSYDSTLFLNFLPRLKLIIKEITYEQRSRIAQCLQMIWLNYFDIGEKKDMAITIGGLFFDLGYYQQALNFYQHSTDLNGIEADTYYNKTLCYYQLRKDDQFKKSLSNIKMLFPESEIFESLYNLDLNAK